MKHVVTTGNKVRLLPAREVRKRAFTWGFESGVMMGAMVWDMLT